VHAFLTTRGSQLTQVIQGLINVHDSLSGSRRTQAPTRIQSAHPFTSMPLAIDARERRVVGVIVAKGIGGDEPLVCHVFRVVTVITAWR
jgi:hypothetical protein